MKLEHERFADWDAAYVLGALAPADRREYEEHLAQCDTCSEAVAELAGMPGLLSRVDAADAERLLEEQHDTDPTPVDLLPRMRASMRRRRRRIRLTSIGASVLAAAAIATALVLPATLDQQPQPTVSVALHQVTPSRLSASLTLTAMPWGTQLEMTCTYEYGEPSPGASQPASAARGYALYVTDQSGTATRVASWTAGPGSTVRPTGTVDIPVAQIASVQVRSDATGKVLLSDTLD